MVDFSKKECIETLESFGWKYLGFLDIGWGEKFYTFHIPGWSKKNPCTMKLGEMRRTVYKMDMHRWFHAQR